VRCFRKRRDEGSRRKIQRQEVRDKEKEGDSGTKGGRRREGGGGRREEGLGRGK
jgi:hypothetical protein